jgi:GrpB-like predicted nucleotidyltransferase (UPF0157 family)
VREAAAEIETETGTVVHAFTTGAMVQVFLLTAETAAKANKIGDEYRDGDTVLDAEMESRVERAEDADSPTLPDGGPSE